MSAADFIRRVAERGNFRREFFVERNMPTTISNILAIPWFGDISSTFLFSSLILKNYKEKHKDKYLILCSWPGFHGLFPYVDEYWCIEDDSVSKSLALEANNFYNTSSLAVNLTRDLMDTVNIQTAKDFQKYFRNGFTKDYWNEFGEIKRFLPEVPSETRLSPQFLAELDRHPGSKLVVFPSTKFRARYCGQSMTHSVPKAFWDVLISRLLEEGITPVVYQNWFTYDMSREFAEKCIYIVPRNVSEVLIAMRKIGLVLDIHSGISRLAIAARVPFLAADERLRFIEEHDYEIDDLCCLSDRQYVFSFSTIAMTGGPEEWKDSIIDNVMVKLRKFLQNQLEVGPAKESYESISYSNVRVRKNKRLGMSFIRSSKEM